VQHARPKVGQLPRFQVGQGREADGVGHFARVGGEDAVDIGPNGNLGRARQRAHDGGGIVGPVAFQGGGGAVQGAGDKAGHNDDARDAVAGGGATPVGRARARPRVQRRFRRLVLDVHRRAVGRGGDDHDFARVERRGVDAARAEDGSEEARAPELAVAHDVVGKGAGREAGDGDGLEDGFQVGDVGVERRDKRVARGPRPQQLVRHVDVLSAQGREVGRVPGVARGRAGDDREEEVGHFDRGRRVRAHRRDDNRRARAGAALVQFGRHQVRDAGDAVGG
jgi:hypothetical protein